MKFFTLILTLLCLTFPALSYAAEAEHAPEQEWHFKGPFNNYDKASLQRGFLVYRQVCAACHSMNRLSYRDLEGIGYDDSQVKAIASEYQIMDGPNDEGEMFERPGRPSDRMKAPFINVKQAQAANGGAYPPDMSLLSFARHGGADHIYGILTGYEAEAPEEFVKHNGPLLPGRYYNKYMAGHVIAMAPPLSDGLVDYPCETAPDAAPAAEEGHGDSHAAVPACVPETVDQYSRDVSEFLQWASDPKMEERKQFGLRVMIFLFFMTLVLYMAKKKLWKNVH